MGDHIQGLPSCFVCFQAHFQVHCPARLLACPPARSRADCRRQNLGSFHQMVCLNLSIQLWTCLLAYCDRGTDILLGISASLVLKPCTLVAQLMCVGICTLSSHLGRKLIISSFTRNHSYSKCNPFFFHKSQPLAITGFTAQTWDAKCCLHACMHPGLQRLPGKGHPYFSHSRYEGKMWSCKKWVHGGRWRWRWRCAEGGMLAVADWWVNNAVWSSC